jgi:hypothetical protein
MLKYTGQFTETSSSQNDDYCFLGCDTMYSLSEITAKYPVGMLPSSSGQKSGM